MRRVADQARCLAADPMPSAPRGAGARPPLPWAHLLDPFLGVYEAEVRRRVSRFDALLGAEAVAAWRIGFLAPLAELCAPSLMARFAVHRALALVPADPDGTTLYRAFVQGCLQDGFAGWLADAPALGRTCAVFLETRIAAAVEFLERYDADRLALADAFFQGRVPGAIRVLEPGLSDPHRGGRTVVGLAPAGGPMVYYHPKDLGLFSGFNDLLGWINAQGNPWPQRLTRCLERPGYGWMEGVAPAACADQQAVDGYFARAGQLLCLLHALNGTDIHCENLIACACHPVLIDLETLLQPDLDPALAAWDAPPALTSPGIAPDSVLRTAMLPGGFSAEGRAMDLSGLAAAAGPPARMRVVRWAHVNADGMAPVPAWVDIPRTNQVCLGSSRVAARNQVSAIQAGFTWMHRFLRANRRRLLGPGGCLEIFRGRAGRFIFRNTELYKCLLEDLAQPGNLQKPSGLPPCLRILARPFQPEGAAHLLWAIGQAEQRALRQRDVPLFQLVTDSRNLYGDGFDSLPGTFVRSGFEAMERRLLGLDEADLDRQLACIQDAFPPEDPAVASQEGQDWRRHPEARAEVLLQAALEVAEALEQSAVAEGPDGVTWLERSQRAPSVQPGLAPLNPWLYEGQAGVAHFLSALAFITGGTGHRDLALAALAPVRAQVRAQPLAGAARQLGLGGATGWGSLVYSLTRCAGWLGRPELLEDAARAAGRIDPERIRQDRAVDVLAGSAGACLGLLALHAAVPGGPWLGSAVACGDRVLALEQPGPGGGGAWATHDPGVFQGGFAHGAAGIGYALARLFLASGADRFRAGAERAFAFERLLSDPERAAWADRWRHGAAAPETGERQAWRCWCHGGPGIGLAWIGALPVLGSDPAGLEAVVTAIGRCGLLPFNHLCCGNFGLAETLLSAGLRLRRPEWCADARRLASAVLDQASGQPFAMASAQMPLFFQGGTGCAYQALRLAYPERLPSALLWE